jgi:hypothetical protein
VTVSTAHRLKDVTDDPDQRLQEFAAAHRRGRKSEAIARLQSVVRPDRMSAGERPSPARSLRA